MTYQHGKVLVLMAEATTEDARVARDSRPARKFIHELLRDYDEEDHPEWGWTEYDELVDKWEQRLVELITEGAR